MRQRLSLIHIFFPFQLALDFSSGQADIALAIVERNDLSLDLVARLICLRQGDIALQSEIFFFDQTIGFIANIDTDFVVRDLNNRSLDKLAPSDFDESLLELGSEIVLILFYLRLLCYILLCCRLCLLCCHILALSLIHICIDILVSSKAKGETLYIPACITRSDIEDAVRNDFYIKAGAEITIMAGCGIHTDGTCKSQQDVYKRQPRACASA